MSVSSQLTSDRLAAHARERVQHLQEHSGPVNVGDLERKASMAAGGALFLWGISRGKLLGLSMTILGGAMVYRGLTGHCSAYEAMGIDTAE